MAICLKVIGHSGNTYFIKHLALFIFNMYFVQQFINISAHPLKFKNMENAVKYIIEFSLQDGQQEAFKKILNELIPMVKANEPGTLNYQLYFNEDETKCYNIEEYIDSPAMLLHLANVGPGLGEILKISSITRLEFFGPLSPEAHAAAASFGALFYTSYAGFTR
jgi:quinol monooxygenase YgiN